MPFWRGRDHESYIGGYDPEYEMPNPDREPRERYMSEAYRHNSRDSRFAYRYDPDRFEARMGPRDHDRPRHWDDGPRYLGDRGGYDRVPDRAQHDRGWDVASGREHYERGFAHGRDWGRREAELELYRRQHSGPYDRSDEREFDRGYNRAIDYDRDRGRRY